MYHEECVMNPTGQPIPARNALEICERLAAARIDLQHATDQIEDKGAVLRAKAQKFQALLASLKTTYASLGLPPLITRAIELRASDCLDEMIALTASVRSITGER
jgi:hypothetical protein